MGCVPARACKQALSEATLLWPRRDKASDGICGDASHQNRPSDHNQGNAFDLTHDPAAGVDCHVESERLRKRVLDGTETRVKYIIWNRRIFNPGVSSNWRAYSGSNPHTKHMHVSIKTDARDNVKPWWGAASPPQPMPATPQEDHMHDRIGPGETYPVHLVPGHKGGDLLLASDDPSTEVEILIGVGGSDYASNGGVAPRRESFDYAASKNFHPGTKTLVVTNHNESAIGITIVYNKEAP